MILLKADRDELYPIYSTQYSSGADVRAAEDTELEPGKVTLVGTGLYINGVMSGLPEAITPDLQLRARSSLAALGIILANGVGTIDADYQDEIKVPLLNLGDSTYTLKKFEKCGQLVMCLANRFPGVKVLNVARTGGFGSTGK